MEKPTAIDVRDAVPADEPAPIPRGGAAVYLKTAKRDNVGFYEKIGFQVREEWDVPGGWPHFWSMLRPGR